jgi:hypothetical protein
MNSHKLIIMFLIISFAIGCSPGTLTPNIQANPTEMSTTVMPLPVPSATTAVTSATPEPDFPEECINLTEVPRDISVLKGTLIVAKEGAPYFLDPKSNQILDIEDKTQVSEIVPSTDMSLVMVSPNTKFLYVSPISKNYTIIRTADKVVKTYDRQGQEDWNRIRWLDDERLFHQNFLAPRGIYSIVIYNPFTGEQKNMQLDLPNPYIVEDIGGRLSWVKVDIDPTLKRMLYNDKDERLVLWDLDARKEIASLPAPTDLLHGSWSPDGKKFAIAVPTLDSSAPAELYMIDMDGTVKMTDFNQKYPFASVDIWTWPEWSPNGRYIAFQLEISNVANPNPDDLRQWLAITDTTTLETQIYCLSGGIVWSPDSTQVIIDTHVSGEEVKPVLVDLTRRTKTALDTHGLFVAGWMAP